MRLLEIVGTDLGAWYMRRNRKNRHRASLAVVESVDEMKIAGTAAPGEDCKLAGDVRVRARGKGRHFLVADVDPFNGFLSAHRVGDFIERITDDPIDSLDPGLDERLNQAFCYCG